MPYATGALLALASLAGAIAIGRARRHYAEADQPALFCALLGFLLSAAAAAAGLMRHGVDEQAAQLWLSQASTFLGLPLLGVAALALGRGWALSRPNWGRVLLGLCACFELFRQMNRLDDYRLLLNLATLLLIFYAGAVQWPRRAPALAGAGVAGLFLLAAGAGGLRRVEPFDALLIPAYPLLAWLLLALPGNAAAEKPVKTL
jgi:hypothetical protein